MKKLVLFAFLVLIIISCQSKKDKSSNQIGDGSWSYCDENGNYVEMHFLESGVILFCPEFNPFGYRSYFEIYNDSLFIFNFMDDRRLITGKLVRNKKVKDRVKMIITLRNNRPYEYHLRRMEEIETLPDPSEDRKSERNRFFVQLFERRKNTRNCVGKENEGYKKPNLDEVDTTFEDVF